MWDLFALVVHCFVVALAGLWEQPVEYFEERKRRRHMGSLPLELVAHVVEALETDPIDQRESSLHRQRTLSACTRATRRMNRYAEQQLFRKPYLTNRIERLTETLVQRPELVKAIQQVTIDLRKEMFPSAESGPATKLLPLLRHTTTIGLMEVRDVYGEHLSALPQLERLHLHMMNDGEPRSFPFSSPPACPPFLNLTCLSLSVMNLPYPVGRSSPISILYLPDVLPNLLALELDDCCVRINALVTTFPRLRYLAIRNSCSRTIDEIDFSQTQTAPLELLELNPHPIFRPFFRLPLHRIPTFKRLRVSPEFVRFKSEKTAALVMNYLVDFLSKKATSPLRLTIGVDLPKDWLGYDDVSELRANLVQLGAHKGVEVMFAVRDEGSRINRATRAACFASDYWTTVNTLMSA